MRSQANLGQVIDITELGVPVGMLRPLDGLEFACKLYPKLRSNSATTTWLTG
jgi:hypothetical protein